MRHRIVVKLFFLTSGLCLLILASIYVGQTILFENYYANNKMQQLSEAVDAFKRDYENLEDDEMERHELEQQFYQENNAWITVLDENGYIKGTSDFYVKLSGGVVLENDAEELVAEEDDINYMDHSFVIPIFYLAATYDDNEQLDVFEEKEDHWIDIHGIEKNGVFFPYKVVLSPGIYIYENKNPYYMLDGGLDDVSYWKNNVLAAKVAENAKENEEVTEKLIYGSIGDVQIPNNYNFLSATTLSNQLFLERIKEFQADLIFRETAAAVSETHESEYEENGISYRLLITEEKDVNGEPIYFFTMASLQPIDEAVGMMKEYYIYIIIAVFILILLAAFYYSKKIASPLLQINSIAKRIANLDFAERVPVRSKDEIGELSKNINFLSDALNNYIQALQRDIEKERQLENTRKKFIAGVSHELKTPLSIIKSCISILQDEVAVDKREHYFSAMNKEVNRMDRLIVDMLELAKFESGTYKMKMEAFFIDDLINNVYGQLSIKARSKRLTVDLQLQSVEVIANQHWIEQVVTNFLTNAIRHTPEAGRIMISAVEEKKRVKISIENEGTPIDPNQLEKIWDRFYQSENNQRSKEGTGLGLAISKNILKLHDAEYGVCNTEKGVRFYFYL
ncbi:HAMP domain-containing protein [Evansella caseinilytica]|uniref:histidine kinase n=1 Tax=Evansella caseinilytica TaxID=1503961 RepID=A0A1H3U4H0_9BACI|nr:HAMP domain-containing sensor histidine kinase [Evansella caseinilytica]SDZ57350.1 HAMP domain-containing protein [Evansella caseinilytica]